MKVLYILNESSFYMKLAWFSMTSLRHYNPDVPVEILLVRDGGRDNRDVVGRERLDLGVPDMTQEQFAHEASSRFGAVPNWVEDYEPGHESGFVPAQRSAFQRVAGEDVLFLDADTFVLEDIGPIFSSDHDVMADDNTWTKFEGTELEGTKSFNSGVVLYRKGLHRDYGRQLPLILERSRGEAHPEGRWLRDTERETYGGEPPKLTRAGREEVAFCLWATGQDSGEFSDIDVQTIKLRYRARVFHTMTPFWLENWPKFFDGPRFKPPRRMRPLLVGPKNAPFAPR